jgi:shikimate 5-dehydrogenase
MGFVGVTTGSSSIMKVFPRWAEALSLPTGRLVGHDLPLDASDQDYRDVLQRISEDPYHLGALVTTHKIRMFQAASDLFEELDDFAQLCGEVSSISKRDGALVGHAKDPLTAGLALEEFLLPGHFGRTAAHVVCLGAGGAGTATTWYLAGREDRPETIVCTDTDESRLAHLQEVHRKGGLDADVFRYVLVGDGADVDGLVSTAPAGSLVINATGLGKDRPGSPLSRDVVFPEAGLIWEMNYRGTLEFLHQAETQQEARDLTVVDGWRYFIHGWTQVIAEVFDIPMEPQTVETLAGLAQELR